MTDVAEKATALRALHTAPELLTVVNVWDAVTARVVSDVPGTRALATASHSVAASRGYEDGENIPVEEMIAEVGLIVASTSLPVTADLEGGYGAAAETVRKAIGVGAVGANIEDQLKPLSEAAAQVEAVMAAAAAEGVPDFVLNARTDAFLLGAEDPLREAVTRGRAYLDAGAPVVFVPGKLDEEQISTLVEAFGPQRLTTIAVPGSVPLRRQQELGVARVSYGPWSQRAALTALADLVESVHAGGGLLEGVRPLN
ncbi:isocitrate lyase/phosphoenolpyruvate mutase family protein [Auraticoccus sp. F435]|uniref:Isocitrate lyase/phosphoenolpyruvate mutase family protein n=1 Tax=Auraticoccus cholistanensis TaxID=2656650 RepID=A0A6A9UTF8_9ACTN|nr:isocitrate lyase/phosphoenolpyruvate mutase family protein [Auraticoccus cholistanensis]MVA74477.1 isocitrate lyase/phosphoenolpyruvate mutase family protein [Auraticoccus cholistanensis]